MAFAVPLVKKDYRLYNLGSGENGRPIIHRPGVSASRSRNSLSRGSFTNLLAARKRSVSDPALSLSQAAAAVASTSAANGHSKRRASHGSAISFPFRLKRKSEGEKDKKEESTDAKASDSLPSTPSPTSPHPPSLQRRSSDEECRNYCGGRRGSGGSMRSGQEQSLYSILTAIAEDEEEVEGEDLEVPIKMLSDSEQTLEDPSLYEPELIVPDEPSKPVRKASIIPPIPEAASDTPILITKTEVAKVARMSPETKRKWKNTFLSTIRTRLGQIERIMASATPAN